jgi:hypothetical protein
MKRALIAIALALTATMWLAGAERATDVNAFVANMLKGVEATRIPCPDEVKTMASSDDVTLVCATIDDDFERFEYLWSMELLRRAMDDRDAETRPHLEPLTAWESSGAVHERVYAVGLRSLGVRVSEGYVLMAYK